MMVEISRNSWHFKLLKRMNSGECGISRSLCGYVTEIFVTLLILSAATAFVLWLGVTPFFAIPPLFGYQFNWAILNTIAQLGETAFKIDVVVVVCVGIIWFIVWYGQRERSFNRPSLIKQYIEAKKAKVCPMIKFTDGEGANSTEEEIDWPR